MILDLKIEYGIIFYFHFLKSYRINFRIKYGSHYKVAIQVFKNNKLFGVGLKSYREEVKNKKYDRDASIHPHQIHFEILSELGIVGYILFLSVFIFNIILAVKSFLIEREMLNFVEFYL